MKKRIAIITWGLIYGISFLNAQQIPLAKPNKIQYKWQEQERIMFVCIDPCTWQGREYDNHSIPLNRIHPDKLNTNQWCEVALSWGAKQILFVAKHTGGFCWWQTETSNYGIRNTPYKNGKGDVLKELSESCKKYGLNLGIYVYPGDDNWGAGIGSGGRTMDPSKQEAYNKVFRQQLAEVLTKYGNMLEVWFDGSCVIPVSDILRKHAKEAVIFQGKDATIRWPGSESGILYYPAWHSVKKEDLKTGLATQYDDDPDGDAWAPLEADVPLYNHNWFWAPANEKKRRSLDELINIYYKSAGYGGVLLLNSSPDTTGRIPEGDVKRYKEFGDEIVRRFSKPLASAKNKKGNRIEIRFTAPASVNHCFLMEDYREGHRIREYLIEGKVNNEWKVLAKGSSVGRKKIDAFETVQVTALRLTVTKSVNKPLIRSFEIYNVAGYQFKPEVHESVDWKEFGTWDTKSFINGKGAFTLDLSPFITRPGQYELQIVPVNNIKTRIDKAEIIFENEVTMQDYLVRKDDHTFYINRTSQVDTGSSSVLKLQIVSDSKDSYNRGVFKIRPRPLE